MPPTLQGIDVIQFALRELLMPRQRALEAVVALQLVDLEHVLAGVAQEKVELVVHAVAGNDIGKGAEKGKF